MAAGLLCQRYFVLGCFLVLGLSGIVVSGTGSFFTYQFHEYGYPEVDANNLVVSSAVLILLGLLTCPLALYFWWFLDNKYNCPQFILFTALLLLLAASEAIVGIVALVKHEQLDELLAQSLENSVKNSEIKSESVLNHAELKINCCDYNETVVDEFIPWTCCDFKRLETTARLYCEDFYGTQCRHLTINRYRSILIHVFLMALCSVMLQAFIASIIIYYAKARKKQSNRRLSMRRRSSVTHAI